MSFDAELVRELQDDGRISVQELATRLGVPRAAVSSRLRELLTTGTVRVIAAVDPAFLGQHVLAHVAIRTVGGVEPVGDHLKALGESVLVSAVAGAHDLITELRVGTMRELHDLIAGIRALPGVDAINTLVYSEVVKGFFFSTYRGELTIDAIDLALIELLQADGRASFRALGDAVRLSPSAVTARVHRLIDAGVIKISAVEARGLASRQVSMGVGFTLDDDAAVLDQLLGSRAVDFAARTLGRFDLVATLVETHSAALFANLERIRTLPGVRHIETWVHLDVLKEDYTRTLRPIRTAPA